MFLSVWKYFTKHVSNTVLPTDIIELFQTSGEKYYIQTWAGYLTVALGLILDSLKAKGNSGLLLVILTYIWIDITWIGFQEIFRKSLKSKTKSSYFSKPELSNSLPRSVICTLTAPSSSPLLSDSRTWFPGFMTIWRNLYLPKQLTFLLPLLLGRLEHHPLVLY